MNKTFGYARVSSRDQNPERQIEALISYGIDERDIIIDKESGKNYDRDGWKALIHMLREGDTVVVKSLDRLGRSYEENLSQWKTITKDIKANIIILDMPLLNTTDNRDLTGTLISDIVLQLLSYVAQTERERIRSRQAEGIAIAKSKGLVGGRPRSKFDESKMASLYDDWKGGKITGVKYAAEVGLTPNTFYRRLREWEKANGKG